MKITDEMVEVAWKVFFDEYLTKYKAAMRSALEAALAAAPTPEITCLFPLIDAQFETVEKGITGTTLAPVKRVEMRDDGSYTVIIDHWPALTPPAQEDEPVAWMYKDGYITRFRQRDATIPLYTRPADSELRKAAEEALKTLDRIAALHWIIYREETENLRAALEGR